MEEFPMTILFYFHFLYLFSSQLQVGIFFSSTFSYSEFVCCFFPIGCWLVWIFFWEKSIVYKHLHLKCMLNKRWNSFYFRGDSGRVGANERKNKMGSNERFWFPQYFVQIVHTGGNAVVLLQHFASQFICLPWVNALYNAFHHFKYISSGLPHRSRTDLRWMFPNQAQRTQTATIAPQPLPFHINTVVAGKLNPIIEIWLGWNFR